MFHSSVSSVDGLIVDFEGPYFGVTGDAPIFRHSLVAATLPPGEWVLADKGFRGSPGAILPYFRNELDVGDQGRVIFNAAHKSIRVIVENTLARFKNFHIMRNEYRGDLHTHGSVAEAVAKLVRLHQEFAPHLIRRYLNRWLFF